MTPVRNTRGFTLLEVLIALLVFTIGMLGMAGLMVVSVKTNQSAYLRTQASFLAQSMADRMRGNLARIADYTGDYDASTTGADPCLSGAACTPANIAVRDRRLWSVLLRDSLPAGSANIACTGASLGVGIQTGAAPYDGLCTFTITWTEANLARDTSATPGAPDTQTFAWVFQP